MKLRTFNFSVIKPQIATLSQLSAQLLIYF